MNQIIFSVAWLRVLFLEQVANCFSFQDTKFANSLLCVGVVIFKNQSMFVVKLGSEVNDGSGDSYAIKSLELPKVVADNVAGETC